MADRKRNISKFDKESGEWVKTDESNEIIPTSELVDASSTPAPSPAAKSKTDMKKDTKEIDSILTAYLGEGMLKRIKKHGVIENFEKLTDANNALVFGGSEANKIKFIQYRKDEDFLLSKKNHPRLIPLASIEKGSISPAGMFSDEKIKKTLDDTLTRLSSKNETSEERAIQANRLDNIRRINNSLCNVFGFDDPRQAEAFLAAWLMKDSTCRLSGIPGTGKTTVVESAGLLLANSYGFDISERFIPQDPSDKDSPFHLILNGQEYDAYLNNNTDGIRVDWDSWRFREWYDYTGPKNNIKIPYRNKNGQKLSGAYLFDNTFLQKSYQVASDSGVREQAPKLGALNPQKFRKALLNVWIWREVVPSTRDGSEYYVYHILPINLGLEAFADGRTDSDGKDIPNGIIRVGEECPSDPRYTAMFEVDYNKLLAPGITIPDGSTLAEEVTKLNLRTDAGRNEGYDLREWLMAHYYDDRVANQTSGWPEIKNEMLREIGTAKIDYDKRADEVLYGMDISQVTRPDPIDKSKKIASYEFTPIPRPVVTQPVKFFNEANRSQAGVEDAILGLIAEKEVEYRGQSFRSPPFVAWMDTNPHQKGNDLAFVDRIDMELLFSTVSLGQRYIQLNAQYNPQSIATESEEKQEISQPQDNIIFNPDFGMASDTIKKAKALRIKDLMALWSAINNIKFTSGSAGSKYNYDGLRDISFLSMLFTQRFMSNPRVNLTGVESRVLPLTDANKIHSSPLLDISKASNEALLNAEAVPGFENNAKAFGDWTAANSQAQTPVAFSRVLGYRFTKSLVKLSRAFAFLRGKDFVTRTEILDALPYVVGHRMGPARAGNDPKGRDLGTIDGALGALTSEQALVREIIVSNYINAVQTWLPGEDAGAAEGIWNPLDDANPNEKNMQNTLLDVWDSYYQKCISTLVAAESFTYYEDKILHPLKRMIYSETRSFETTPIHWHIAAFVVEAEKKATSGGCLRQDDGMTYAERYNMYFKAMNAPTRDINPLIDNVPSTAEAIQENYSLYDYYYLRGKIANEPLLFTDDKTYLLGLVESRINAFVGPGFNLNPEEAPKISYAISNDSIWTSGDLSEQYIIKPNPAQLLNSTYGDGIGAFGQMFGGDVTIDQLKPVDNWEDLAQVQGGSEISYQTSNQRMQISGTYRHHKDNNDSFIPISKSTCRSPRTYLAASEEVTNSFRPWTSGLLGVAIDPGTKNIVDDNLDFSVTMDQISMTLEEILLNPDIEIKTSIKNVSSASWMPNIFTDRGHFFCFDLRHYGNNKCKSLLLLMKDKGLIDKTATEVYGDQLKLWVWTAAHIDTEDTKTITLVTTYGITSSFLENSITNNNKLDMPGNFVSIDNNKFYTDCSEADNGFIDSGNITESDVKEYNSLFIESIRRSTQGS